MKKKISPAPAPAPAPNAWRESAEMFSVAAKQTFEDLRQTFLNEVHVNPIAAIEEHGSDLVRAQVVHEHMQTVQMLLDEAGTQLDAFKAVQEWTNRVTVEASAAFSRSFASDLTGVCKETAASYRLQFLQTVNSPLNRLLRQLSGMQQ